MDKDAHRIDFDWAFDSVELRGIVSGLTGCLLYFFSSLVLFHTSPLPLPLFFVLPTLLLTSLLSRHFLNDSILTSPPSFSAFPYFSPSHLHRLVASSSQLSPATTAT